MVDAVSILKAHFHAHVLMDGVATLVNQRQNVTVPHVKMEVRVKVQIIIHFAAVNLAGQDVHVQKWIIATQINVKMAGNASITIPDLLVIVNLDT